MVRSERGLLMEVQLAVTAPREWIPTGPSVGRAVFGELMASPAGYILLHYELEKNCSVAGGFCSS